MCVFRSSPQSTSLLISSSHHEQNQGERGSSILAELDILQSGGALRLLHEVHACSSHLYFVSFLHLTLGLSSIITITAPLPSRCIKRHFPHLLDSDDFVHLNLESLMSFLKHDDLNVNEEDAWKAVRIWIRFDAVTCPGRGPGKGTFDLLSCLHSFLPSFLGPTLPMASSPVAVSEEHKNTQLQGENSDLFD